MKRSLPVLLLLSLTAAAAQAQPALYGGLSAADYHLSGVGWQFGPTVGAYWDPIGVPFVKAGLDARASWIGSGDSKDDSFMIGPRVQIKPHVIPIMPYVELLGGVSQVTLGPYTSSPGSGSPGSTQSTGTDFSWEVNAGVDMTFAPHLDLRVEYARADVTDLGQSFNPTEVTTGLVLRLP